MTQYSPARLVAQYLVDNNLVDWPPGNTTLPASTWYGFYASMPELGDSAVCVYDTTPTPDGRYHRGAGDTVEHPGIQIRVRHKLYDPGWAKAFEIQQYLDLIKNTTVTVDSVPHLLEACTQTAGLTFIGQEEKNKRQLFTLNRILTLKRSD